MAEEEKILPQEIFFRLSEDNNGPWEINRPQTTITNLVEKGILNGKILDIGCGLGDNAIYIAKQTNNANITAIDLVPKSVITAREKAEKNQVNIRFEVVNMLDNISKTNILQQHSYDTVLDAAVFHFFSDEDRQHYIKNLEYLIKPGSVYIQIGFSEKETYDKGPRRIKKTDLEKLFSSQNGWTIESIEDSVYEFKPDADMGQKVQAYLSIIRRNNTIDLLATKKTDEF